MTKVRKIYTNVPILTNMETCTIIKKGDNMAKKCILLGARKGFTLVELLVAATIIGILMVFATNSYRNGVAETRWAQAKGNVDQLAAAVLRARIEYPASAVFSSAVTAPLMANIFIPLSLRRYPRFVPSQTHTEDYIRP